MSTVMGFAPPRLRLQPNGACRRQFLSHPQESVGPSVSMRAGMGVRNYLIEGGSGSGKSAVCSELQRRGFHAIDGDRELACRGDPTTGEPFGEAEQDFQSARQRDFLSVHAQ